MAVEPPLAVGIGGVCEEDDPAVDGEQRRQKPTRAAPYGRAPSTASGTATLETAQRHM